MSAQFPPCRCVENYPDNSVAYNRACSRDSQCMNGDVPDSATEQDGPVKCWVNFMDRLLCSCEPWAQRYDRDVNYCFFDSGDYDRK